MDISTTKTVRELALEIPEATRVFEKFGIDYCCGGGKVFSEACTAAGLSTDEVVQSLENAQRETKSLADETIDWRRLAHSAFVGANLSHRRETP
ncbi:MAG TPA: DUF542 domain-containing protein [Blastocatellia bacterium]|nr:DUF542 domain-containing protein [Blastocatellia bacterium]